jgi:hypothetical protein
MTTVYYAVYDSDIDSDFYPYDTEADALATALRWANEDWYRELVADAEYCSITLYAVTYDGIAPWDADEDWCLWFTDDKELLEVVA